MSSLQQIAQHMVAPGKGILAADESNNTAGKRLASIGQENSEDNRRAMRETFFTTPNLGDYISGAILYDETFRQASSIGKLLRDILADQNIYPGIKVDEGLVDFEDGAAGEKVTTGLEGLPTRMPEYAKLGAKFAKWRAVFLVGEGLPTEAAITENCDRLAHYAKECQENGIVPIVEPEVLMDDPNHCTHSLQDCYNVTDRVLSFLFEEALVGAGVDLTGIVLKPNMIVPGKNGPKASVQEVAEATVKVLKKNVPAEVPGIAFLSGGQSDQDATLHLDAMNRMGDLPWALTFSYGRALQAPALQAWGGKPENVQTAQQALITRARCNSAAATGSYQESLESAA